MVAGMAAPAYAGIYYIGDGNITITKDEKGDVYVKHANSTDKTKGDLDKGEITIKGGKRSEDTPASGSGSSGTGTTGTATSPAQSNLTTLNSEDDSDNEAEDKVYLGDTKGGGEENENQSGGTTGGEENENQTGDTTGGEKNETDFTKRPSPATALCWEASSRTPAHPSMSPTPMTTKRPGTNRPRS